MSAKTGFYATHHHPLGTGGLWKHNGLQLPAYIQNVAKGIMESGKDKTTAIEMAIGTVRRWARGGGNVTPEVRAASAAAIAEWDALVAAFSNVRDADVFEFVRTVRTAAGVAKYHLPIGSPIIAKPYVPRPRQSGARTVPGPRSNGGEHGYKGAQSSGRRNHNWPSGGGGLGGLGGLGQQQQKGNTAQTNYLHVSAKKPAGGAGGGKAKGKGSAAKKKDPNAAILAAQKKLQAARTAAARKLALQQLADARKAAAREKLLEQAAEKVRAQQLVTYQNSNAYTGVGGISIEVQRQLNGMDTAQQKLQAGDLEGAAQAADTLLSGAGLDAKQRVIWQFIADQLRRLNAIH